MLRWRLLLGTFFVLAMLGLSWLDFTSATPGIYLLPLAVLLALLAAGEMLRISLACGGRPMAAAVYLGTALVVGCSFIPHLCKCMPADCPIGTLGWPLLGMTGSVFLVFAGELLRFGRSTDAVKNLSLAIFSIAYVGLSLSFVVQLRFVSSAEWGMVALASLLIVVKMCDIGAYTVGRLFGRHKLAPSISPGKTIEGLLGGLVFACVGSWFTFTVLAPAMVVGARPSAFSGILLYGILLGATGVIGDLAESVLKREANVKDSSDWLPGFGGVLDLLDSLLIAAPIAWLLWIAQLVGPAAYKACGADCP